jgi:hypothetical protein
MGSTDCSYGVLPNFESLREEIFLITSWGTQITLGWEYEGDGQGILNWYYPEHRAPLYWSRLLMEDKLVFTQKMLDAISVEFI